MGDHPLRPPSHRRHGGPLPRRPANGTHAHPTPPELCPVAHAGHRGRGVLIRLSAGYPPGSGRLHTRYAPVRRSPAAHCCAPLPLDLHVLGLPLAFILSQDQTLRCTKSLPLGLLAFIYCFSLCPGCFRSILSFFPVAAYSFSSVPSRQRTFAYSSFLSRPPLRAAPRFISSINPRLHPNSRPLTP